MAQIQNVRLSIGPKESKSPSLGRPVIVGREVTVQATFQFTAQEIGLKYRVYTTIHSSDRYPQDPDGIERPIVISLDEDYDTTKILDMTDGFTFRPSKYSVITVNNTTMEFTKLQFVAVNTLDEDKGGYVWDGFRIRYEDKEDELFARINLGVVADSPVSQMKVA